MSDEQQLTHLDAAGQARMVDVGAKADTERVAVAEAIVYLLPATIALIQSGTAPKGDVLAVTRIAGIMGAKRTSELIPLCHPLPLTSVHVAVTLHEPTAGGERGEAIITARAATHGPTGVEMEALTAASVAALALYDMIKAVDRGASYTVRLLEKSGGKSGYWRSED
jgi:cyclic pyranopterin phosphate synthase